MTQPTGGYTPQEISDATSALVQTTVRYQTDSLGARDLTTTFSDVQQAAIGVFLLFPTALFYTMQLGASRLNEELQTQATNVAQLLSLVQAAGRVVLPVNDITPLSNASAALFALQGAAASRTTPFSSIQATPAYKNFSSNVDAFLAANGSNVKAGGQVVPTPQDAKAQIATLLSTILTTQQDLITKAGFLQKGLDDYNSADLPAVATSSVFQNATQSIATLTAQLEQQSPTQRLSSLRSTVLSLLAARGVVGGMGSAAQPSNIYPVTGSGTPYSDATHAAIPATLAATKYAPYNLTNNPVITIGLDGGIAVSGNLNNGIFAEQFGTKLEQYTISGTTAASYQTNLSGPYTVTAGQYLSFMLSSGFGGPAILVNISTTLAGSQTATALAGDLNIQLGIVNPSLALAYQFTTDVTTNFLIFEAQFAGAAYGFTINPGNLPVGFAIGTQVFGTDNGQTLRVTETTSNTTVSVIVPTGTYTAQVNVIGSADITSAGLYGVGGLLDGEDLILDVNGGGFVTLNLNGATNAANETALLNAIKGQWPALSFAVQGPGTTGVNLCLLALQQIIVGSGSANGHLGLTPGTYSDSLAFTLQGLLSPSGFTALAQGNVGSQFIDIRYVGGGSIATPPLSAGVNFPASANPVATTLGLATGITTFASPATARSVSSNLNSLFSSLNATVGVDPVARGANINIRSEPSDPSRFVAYLFSGSGTAVGATGSVTVGGLSGLLEAGVEVNDIVVFRTGANTNTKWTISTVTDSGFTATGSGTSTSGACTLEIGPPFASVTKGYVVQIASGINNGIYTITQQGPTSLAVPFEFEVNAIVHGVVQANGQPYVTTGNIGQEKVVFNSKNTTTSSAISISGAGSSFFFTGTAPFTAVGTTPWLLLPETVNGVGPGDAALYFQSVYNVASQTFTVTSVSGQILGITPPMPDDLTLPFNSGVPPPFALLENGAYAAFQTFSGELKTWLAASANQSQFFAKLQVALNVVMKEAQTTAAQINTAVNLIIQLQNLLVQASSSTPTLTLEYALVNYSVNRVAPIDNLVKTYSEKGSDAAIDTLLGGQFAEFFGLTQDTVSYAGAMQAQVRAVALNDLPVRRIDRTSMVTSPVVSQSTSPDFEYDSSDIDKTTPPQTPTMFEAVSPTESNNP